MVCPLKPSIFREPVFSPVMRAGNISLNLREGFKAEGSSQVHWRIDLEWPRSPLWDLMWHNREKILHGGLHPKIEKGAMRTKKYSKPYRVTTVALRIK